MRRLAVAFVIACCPAAFAQDKAKIATPDDAFKAFQAALKKKDWRGAAGHLTRDSQQMIAGGVLMACGSAEELGLPLGPQEAKGIQELLAQHSIPPGAAKGLLAKLKEIESDPRKMTRLLREMGQRIHNKPEFIAGFIKVLGRLPGVDDAFEEVDKAALGPVKIDGDTARGKINLGRGDVNRSETILFRREEGSWKLDLLRTIDEQFK